MNDEITPKSSERSTLVLSEVKGEVMERIYVDPDESLVDGEVLLPTEQARRVAEKKWGKGANVVRLGSAALADRSHLAEVEDEASALALRDAFASVIESKLKDRDSRAEVI